VRSGLPDFALYRPLFAEPRFRNQALAGFFAQLTQGGTVLALILLVQQARGSLGLAGAVAAAFVVGAAIARPIQGRLIDTRGPRRVLIVIAAAQTVALLVLVPIVKSDLPGIVPVLMSLIAGLGLPPVSQVQRLVWAGLVGEDRTTVYSVIGMIQEGSILAGPLLVGVLAGVASPSAALIVVAVVSGAGLFWLGLVVPDLRATSEEDGEGGGLLREPAVRLVLLLEFLFGVALSGIEIGVPALATSEGHPSTAGFLLAVTSVGGIAGGLLYGGRSWASRPRTRLALLLALSTIGFAVLVPVDSLILAGGILIVLGMVLTPVITTLIVLLDLASPRFLAEAFGWSSTSSAIGTGGGAALVGVLAQHHGAGPAFAIGAAGCALALVVALAARGLPRTGQPASPG
jgi:predicted MFS family arabinose efflux permease